jgi:putative endonuclease
MGGMVYFVYILQSERDGSYYVGHTGNLEGRLRRHNEGRSRDTRRIDYD